MINLKDLTAKNKWSNTQWKRNTEYRYLRSQYRRLPLKKNNNQVNRLKNLCPLLVK